MTTPAKDDIPVQATRQKAVLPLNTLVEWPANPRKTRNTESIRKTASSLVANGQMMPCLVYAADAKGLHYVIDGETRRQAFNLNVDDQKMEADEPVDVTILEGDLSEADLLRIAMVVNTDRENMNPIEEMEAYASMAKAGMKPVEISQYFNISARQVTQRIALGDLIEPARDLVRNGERNIRWAEAMTMGSPAQQEQIVNEVAANPHAWPDGDSVRSRMKNGAIPVSSALFDPDLMADSIMLDLFTTSTDTTFTDSDRFWELQNAEIDKMSEEAGKTHKRIDIFRGRRFNEAGWMTGGEPADSVAVIIVRDDGSVELKEGMVPPADYYADEGQDSGDIFADASAMFGSDLETTSDDSVDTDSATEEVKAYDPLASATKATEAYLEAQLVAQLRNRAASDHRVSMAFVIAQTLTRNGKLASSMEITGYNLDAEDRTSAVFQKISAREAAIQRILSDSGLLGIRSPARAVEILLGLEDDALNSVFSWFVSQSVNPGLTDTAFDVCNVLGETPLEGWRIDEQYIGTLTNAQKRALAVEVVPESELPSPSASLTVVTKTTLAAVENKELQGDWTGPSNSWLPPQITEGLESAFARAEKAAEAAQALLDAQAEDAGDDPVAAPAPAKKQAKKAA
ncbi:MAG: hypothetical protein CL472_06740 [Acidobacteria bacterium]|nr:hypothetical protein [Acidobacteriota bacterium]